jgi:uridine phosphorylase
MPDPEKGRTYHLGLAKGEFPDFVMTAAHAERVPKMAARFEAELPFEPAPVIRGGFVLRKGLFRGIPVGAVNSGIYGGSSVCLEELARLGCHTVIRSGTCAALAGDIACGDVIINTGAMRLEGVTDYYVPPSFPAVSHPETVMALVAAAERLGIRYHLGIGASTAGFYVPQGRAGANGYLPPRAKALIPELQEMGILNLEGQVSTHFVLAALYGFRAGAVLSVVANRVTGEFGPWEHEEQAISVALEAISILSEWDAVKRAAGKPVFYPGIAPGAEARRPAAS